MTSPSGSREGRPVSVVALSSVPDMPKVPRDQLYRGTPYLLLQYSSRHSLGWQDSRTVGPSFVVARLLPLGSIKVRERFPLTQEGWASAWQALCRRDADAAAAIMRQLAYRAEQDRAAAAMTALGTESLCRLRTLTLKGASGDAPLARGWVYDLRFLSDRLTICTPASVEAVVDVPYREIDAVEVSGSGATGKTPGEVALLVIALGVLGALLGLLLLGPAGLFLGAVILGLVGALIAAASNRAETVIRVSCAHAEYFFVHKYKSPDALRMELSGSLRAIDAAHGAQANSPSEPAEPASGSIPDQLSKLASLLQQGLVTRDEFDHLKARLIAGP